MVLQKDKYDKTVVLHCRSCKYRRFTRSVLWNKVYVYSHTVTFAILMAHAFLSMFYREMSGWCSRIQIVRTEPCLGEKCINRNFWLQTISYIYRAFKFESCFSRCNLGNGFFKRKISPNLLEILDGTYFPESPSISMDSQTVLKHRASPRNEWMWVCQCRHLSPALLSI